MLVRADLSASTPLFVGADQLDPATDEVAAGVVHLGIPFDDAWSLSVDGAAIEPRRAFGETTAFDVSAAGMGELRYDSSALRLLAVIVQTLLWLAAIFIAARVRVTVGRRESLLLADETLIDLTEGSVPSLVDPGLRAEPDVPDADLAGPDRAGPRSCPSEPEPGPERQPEVPS